MVIQIDSREKSRAIQRILEYFDTNDVKHFISKLPVGDYMSYDNPRLVIDRKQNLLEVAQNVAQGHERFIKEIKRANEFEIKIVFLVEHGGNIHTLEDVQGWKNPRLVNSPLALSGERLFKIMTAIQGKYGVEWLFCDKRSTGKRIVEILGG